MKTTKSTPSLEVGDRVQVVLPGGVYVGVIRDEFQDYARSGEVWCGISGEKPVPFVTIARKSSLMPVHEIYGEL